MSDVVRLYAEAKLLCEATVYYQEAYPYLENCAM